MGKPIAVPTEGIGQLIKDAYNMCEQYQWAREATVNGIEAGASWIFLGVDAQGLKSTGVARRYIADNGHGMTPEQLEVFLSMFGGGGKAIGFDANRGVGLKASAYTWNTYGFVVISWTEESPDGAMVWIHQDADGIWEQRSFEIYGDDGEVEDIATIVAPFHSNELDIDFRLFKSPEITRAKHGTVVLFLGDGPTRNTDQGDYTKDENTILGIAKYLNSRLLDVPKGVSITVEAVEGHTRDPKFTDKELAIHLPEGKTYPVRNVQGKIEGRGVVFLHTRNIKGLREFLPVSNPAKFPDAKSGSIKFPYRGRQVEVEWAYHPKLVVTNTDGTTTSRVAINGADPYGPTPRIVYRYDQPTKYALLSEAYVTQTHYQQYKRYGFSELKDGLYLIVHLPEWDSRDPNRWGVMPQQSRAALIGAGGVPDFEEIVEQVSDHFFDRASELKEIVTAELAKRHIDTGNLREALKRTIGRLADRMRPTKAFKDPDGKKTGTELDLTDAGPNRRGGTRPKPEPTDETDENELPGEHKDRKTPTGTGSGVQKVEVDITLPGATTATKQRQSDGIPSVEWDKSDKFLAAGIPHLAVMFDPKGDPDNAAGLVTLNPKFGMFQQEFTYWKNHWPKTNDQKIVDLVQEVYAAEAVSKVTHITKLKMQEHRDADGKVVRLGASSEYKEMLSPAALTASITGLVNVEQHITTRGGGKFGKASAAPAAVPVVVAGPATQSVFEKLVALSRAS